MARIKTRERRSRLRVLIVFPVAGATTSWVRTDAQQSR